MQMKHKQLCQDNLIARKEQARQDAGTYKSGMNMDEGGVDGYTEENLRDAASRQD
jgi:hypothetical protein